MVKFPHVMQRSSKLIKCDAYNCGGTFHCKEALEMHMKTHKWIEI